MLGALRGDRAHVIRTVIGLVVLVAATVAAGIAVLSLRDSAGASPTVVTVLAGSAVTLGFAVAPLVLGVVDPLDPRRFGVLDIPPGRLAATLAVVGVFSVPTLVLIALSVTTAVMWIDRGASATSAVLSAVLGVLTCSLFARVAEGLSALVIRERRSRELTGLFLVAVLVIVVPVGVFLASLEWRGQVPPQLREATDILALTPFGAAWSLSTDSGAGFALPLVVAIVSLVLLAAAWAAIVRHALTTTERPVAVRERGGLGWFAVAPGTPGGAVAARSLVYWLRDRRHGVNIVVVPVAAALTMVPLLVVGVPIEIIALVPVPIMALFFGWLPHNDLAYDSTAVWMHIASGVRGVSDRVGRLVPMLLIGAPLLAIAVPVAIAFHGRWATLPALAGVCASLFLVGLGLSSVASAAAPYPVARPGDSPFQQPQRTGAGGAIAQSLVLLGAIVFSAPALWWAWLSLSQDVSYAWAALWGGVIGGLIVLVVGIAIGARVFERGGSRLMEFAESA